MKQIALNSLKLAATGGVIAAIWFVALTTETNVEVPEAHADILGLNIGDDGQGFTRAMESLGLEPRPYDFNGNVMYFAAGTTPKTPAELEPIFAQALQKHGVNKRDASKVPAMATAAAQNWRFPSNPDGEQPPEELFENFARLEPQGGAMVDGEVVTVAREPDLLRMVGMEWNSTKDEMLEQMKTGDVPAQESGMKKFMGGYKYIEANYDRNDGTTSITAVWNADREFDASKMDNTSFLSSPPDANIPPCMGCDRRYRMKSLAADEPIQGNNWHTNMSMTQTYDYYKNAMAARGWTVSEAQKVLDKAAEVVPELAALEGRVLNLEQDGKTMQIVLIPSEEGGTEVFSQERFQGAPQILK